MAALEAALADVKKHKPDRILVAGDLVFYGPRPAETVDRLRALEADGAAIIAGNTDVAVADFDYAAAFPWLDDVPAGHRAAAEWAHEQLSDDQLDWLRGLPSERRVWADGVLVLACHGSPGSQTAGLSTDLDPTVTVERVTRTDARVIACGHTHIADMRELGRKLILNPGSCGVAFDGDPAACWALLTVPDQASDSEDETTRTWSTWPTRQPSCSGRPTTRTPRPRRLSQRGLPTDVYRAATIRTGRLVT